MGSKSKRGRKDRPSTSTSSSPDMARAIVQEEHLSQRIVTGPIPPPETLQGYADIDPGFPERIVKMAEGEQGHRHEMEREALDANIDDLKRDRMEARLGQVFALVIGLAAIIGGVVAAVYGAQWSGSIIGGGTVAALVAVFVYGRKSREASNEENK